MLASQRVIHAGYPGIVKFPCLQAFDFGKKQWAKDVLLDCTRTHPHPHWVANFYRWHSAPFDCPFGNPGDLIQFLASTDLYKVTNITVVKHDMAWMWRIKFNPLEYLQS